MSVDRSTRIGVLMGGVSGEREVSLRSGTAMAKALRTKGYEHVIDIDVDLNVAEVLKKERIEVACIALHGRFGEDGTMQGILEFLRIPYTGSGVTGSAVAMDKVISKRVFQACNVPTPAWTVTYASQPLEEVKEAVETLVGFPTVAKPPCEGSTLGLTICESPADIEGAIATALKYQDVILWEEYIEGAELTVGILSDRPLPIVEIRPKSGFYDYASKYTKGATEYFCPARVSEEVANRTLQAAVSAFSSVGAESFGRVDIRYSPRSGPWVLEVNTVPGMTETSLVPKAAAAAGISFEDMVETLVKEARLKTAQTK